MGDPKKQRKKYSGPQHPWRRTRIEEEKILVEEYGLRNKKDLWKMSSTLGHFKKQAKALIARVGAQADSERKLFLAKLQRLNLVGADGTVDNVLSLSVKDILERRLQTLMYRKGLAHSVLQARQFIVHGHAFIHGQKMNIPSYLVPAGQEQLIQFDPRSALADPEHPERKVKEIAKTDEKVEKKKTEETVADVLEEEVEQA